MGVQVSGMCFLLLLFLSLLLLLSVSLILSLSYKEIMGKAQSTWSRCPLCQRHSRENRTVWSISRASKAVWGQGVTWQGLTKAPTVSRARWEWREALGGTRRGRTLALTDGSWPWLVQQCLRYPAQSLFLSLKLVHPGAQLRALCPLLPPLISPHLVWQRLLLSCLNIF